MRRRRAIATFCISTIMLGLLGVATPYLLEGSVPHTSQAPAVVDEPVPAQGSTIAGSEAGAALETLAVKGRATKTGYERSQFGSGWSTVNGCSTRDIILNRDLLQVQLEGECRVVSGTLNDPYTATVIIFSKESASNVQIDHVVALSDAWQKGAQNLTTVQRKQLANDPLELLAVDGPANQQKSDGDAATWLPKNKAFRCEYVARQIAIKAKYALWVTPAEKDAMSSVLAACPNQLLPQ